jgi:hypothetical protein
MPRKGQFIFVYSLMAVLLSGVAFSAGSAVEQGGLDYIKWVGEDLYLKGREVVTAPVAGKSDGEHILLFEGEFSMSIGANRFFSDSAVVWLTEKKSKSLGRVRTDYEAKVYLQGDVSAKKGRCAKSSSLSEKVLTEGRSMVVRCEVGGEVFVTAQRRKTGDPRGMELYQQSIASGQFAGLKFEQVPLLTSSPADVGTELPTENGGAVEVSGSTEKEPRFRYPVNIQPAGDAAIEMESTRTAAGEDVMTVIGRFYLSQKDEEGGLLELQADSAVVWYVENSESPAAVADTKRVISENIKAIYLSGDVVMTSGQRTIRAEEIYYDFERNKALAVKAVMRNFDVKRGIPIYVRAEKLRQLAENKFAAEDITLTSSEFYQPQISLNASSVIITDTTPIDERTGKLGDGSYEAEMRDVRFKVEDTTFFYWPFLRSNLQRPDVPIKSIRVGNDNVWGTSVETRWYLSRLLGLRETEEMDSTLALDYYGKRGFGSGVEIDYAQEDSFGRLLGYVIRDHGEDRLGRHSTRRDLEPPRELRGRFLWQHRQFLPHDWQLTSEVSYISDENFIEGYYRSEYDVGKEQEALVHLKRIEDNWGLAFLGKGRINDFADKLEEMPSAEFHWTGQSLFDDRFTFYSDSQVSRFRQRLASGSTSTVSEEFYTFMSERAELDMPMALGFGKVVPFVAGTAAFEDGSGFYTDIDGGAAGREDDIWIGEAGARIFPQPVWKVYPDVKSRLWDLNGLRHIIEPRVTAVGFTESDSVAEQRDILNVGITQRLQTKRGAADKQRTTDWMRLDMDVTWLENSGDSSAGADQFIWNKPFIPLVNRFSRRFGQSLVPAQDRRSSDMFGPRRNYFGANYMWHVSDTTAVLSDMNYDMQSGVVQQLNVGFSRLRWPNLSYYIGSRYLRRIDNGYGEEGSNAFTFAASYVLDPRYTVIFSQQVDCDYGANIRSEMTLVRRYHRLCYGFTFRVDESMDRQSVIFSIWPEGVAELGIGPKRYMGQGGPIRY